MVLRLIFFACWVSTSLALEFRAPEPPDRKFKEILLDLKQNQMGVLHLFCLKEWVEPGEPNLFISLEENSKPVFSRLVPRMQTLNTGESIPWTPGPNGGALRGKKEVILSTYFISLPMNVGTTDIFISKRLLKDANPKETRQYYRKLKKLDISAGQITPVFILFNDSVDFDTPLPLSRNARRLNIRFLKPWEPFFASPMKPLPWDIESPVMSMDLFLHYREGMQIDLPRIILQKAELVRDKEELDLEITWRNLISEREASRSKTTLATHDTISQYRLDLIHAQNPEPLVGIWDLKLDGFSQIDSISEPKEARNTLDPKGILIREAIELKMNAEEGMQIEKDMHIYRTKDGWKALAD